MMRWNSTKTYREEDIIKMQQEAVSRVHEFQERAQNTSTYYDMPVLGEARPILVAEAESKLINPPVPLAQAENQSAFGDPISGLLDKFNIDSETLLIMGLIFVLYNEKADNLLLVALAYLLL